MSKDNNNIRFTRADVEMLRELALRVRELVTKIDTEIATHNLARAAHEQLHAKIQEQLNLCLVHVNNTKKFTRIFTKILFVVFGGGVGVWFLDNAARAIGVLK